MMYGVDMFAGTVDFLRNSKNGCKGNGETQERLSKSSDSIENAWRKEVRSDVKRICWKCSFEKWRWKLKREEAKEIKFEWKNCKSRGGMNRMEWL